MRKLLAIIAATTLMAGSSFADPNPPEDKQQSHGSGSTYGSTSSYGSATHGGTLNPKTDDHTDHMMGSKTMPADGAILQSSPEHIGVNFGHDMSLEAVTLSTLTGEMIELDVANIGVTNHFMLNAPELQADDYIVDWRARGSDGHRMSGSFTFTVE